MIKKIFSAVIILSLISLLLMTGCIGVVIGSSVVSTREMNFNNFQQVEAGWAFEVEISQASSYRVSVTTNDNLFDYIDISNRGGTLVIGLRGRTSYVRTTQKVTITMPDLKGVTLTGASKGKISGFSSNNPLNVELSGASSLEMDGIKTGDAEFVLSGASRTSGNASTADVRFELSGASVAEISGSASNMVVGVSGASRALLVDFKVNDATVNLSGASQATIQATGRLDAELSGASQLRYTGHPTLGRISTSGGSSIRPVE